MSYRSLVRFSVALMLVLACGVAQANLAVVVIPPSSVTVNTGSSAASVTFAVHVVDDPSAPPTPGPLLVKDLKIEFGVVPALPAPPSPLGVAPPAAGPATPFPAGTIPFTGGASPTFGTSGNFSGYLFSLAPWAASGAPEHIFDVTVTIPVGVYGVFDLAYADATSTWTEDLGGGATAPHSFSLPGGGVAPPVVILPGTMITAIPEPSAFFFGGVVVSLIGGAAFWNRKRKSAA